MLDGNRWLYAYESLVEYYSAAILPARKFEYDANGIKRIPFTNKDWVRLTNGIETPPKTGMIWLPTNVWVDRNGHLHEKLCPYGSMHGTRRLEFRRVNEWAIIWSAVKNTILIKKVANIPIRETAIKDSLFYYIKDNTTCPKELHENLAEIISYIALSLIDEHCDKSVEDIAKLSDFKPKGATDRATRKKAWDMLMAYGVEDKRTRAEQDDIIKKVLSRFPNLKPTEKNNLEKRLRDKKALKSKNPSKTERAAEIKWKLQNKITLTGAERKFKCKFKELFIEDKDHN